MLPDDDYDWGAFARAAHRPEAPIEAPREPGRARFGVDGVVKADLWEVDPVTGARTLVEHQESHNMVVNSGLNWLRSLFDNITPVTFLRQRYAAIGTGGTAVAATDTALGTETAREVNETYAAGGTGVCTITTEFAAGVGTGMIAEAGLFDTNAAGIMFDRTVFGSAIDKTASRALTVSWVFTFTST